MPDEEVLGLKFAATVTGIGLVSDLSETVASLYRAALNADLGFTNLASSVVSASNVIAGSAFFGAPAAFLVETIRQGSLLEDELTKLTVAYQGNREAAVNSFRDVRTAVDLLPISTLEALDVFTRLKLQGIDALLPFREEVRMLGTEIVPVKDTILSMIADIAAFRRESVEGVALAVQRAVIGQPILLRQRLGPGGAEIANQLVGGSREAFQRLFEFIEKKGIRGLALEQSITFKAFLVGLKDAWQTFFQEMSGLLGKEGGLFRGLKDAVTDAYFAIQLWFRDIPRVQALARSVSNAFMPLVDFLGRVIREGTRGFLRFLDFLAEHPFATKAILWTSITLGMANAFQVLLRVFDFFLGGFFSGVLGIITGTAKLLSIFAILRAAILYFFPAVDILTISLMGLRSALSLVHLGWVQLVAIFSSARVVSTFLSLLSSFSAPTSFIAGLIEGGFEFIAVFGRMILTIGAGIGLFLSFAAIVRGFFRTVRFDAMWEGFIEGFKDAQSLFQPFFTAFGVVKDTIDSVFTTLNESVDRVFAFFGLSQNAFNMWRDIGYMVGFVAGIIGTVLYGAFKLVLGIVQLIARAIGAIITGLQFIGGVFGVGLPSLGAPGNFFQTTPSPAVPGAGPSFTPAQAAGRGQVSISVGEMPITVQVPVGTSTEQAKSIMEQVRQQQVGMFSGLAEEYGF